MKFIPLTQGQFAIVDDADFEFLNQWKWYAQKTEAGFYASRCKYRRGPGRLVLMHRLVANAKESEEIDHWNRNTLDNQRLNLRVATVSQNAANRKISTKNTSGHKGVCWNKERSKWHAYFYKGGKIYNLGFFDDKTEAAQVRELEFKKAFGQFAANG